jgi:hypothetical protein
LTVIAIDFGQVPELRTIATVWVVVCDSAASGTAASTNANDAAQNLDPMLRRF